MSVLFYSATLAMKIQDILCKFSPHCNSCSSDWSTGFGFNHCNDRSLPVQS